MAEGNGTRPRHAIVPVDEEMRRLQSMLKRCHAELDAARLAAADVILKSEFSTGMQFVLKTLDAAASQVNLAEFEMLAKSHDRRIHTSKAKH